MDRKVAGEKRFPQLNELDEFRNEAYEMLRSIRKRKKCGMTNILWGESLCRVSKSYCSTLG